MSADTNKICPHAKVKPSTTNILQNKEAPNPESDAKYISYKCYTMTI